MKMFFINTFILLISSNLILAKVTDDDLKSTVKMVNNSLASMQDAGNIKLPCVAAISDNLTPLDPEFSANGVDDRCFNFFDDKGKLGPWGQNIIKTIDSLPKNDIKNSFLSNKIPDMEYICPNFPKFNDDLKKKFWVWTFAAISWQESSCKPKQTAQGVNSRAVGLLQLEDSRRLREGRGDKCEVANITEPNNNLNCGVEILHQQLLGPNSTYFNTSTGELFWKGSYWQHLRFKKRNQQRTQALIDKSQTPSNGKTDIKELIMRFPQCR